MKRSHSGLADRRSVTLLGGLPEATLQVAGSGEADLDGAVDHENVVEHCKTLVEVHRHFKPSLQ